MLEKLLPNLKPKFQNQQNPNPENDTDPEQDPNLLTGLGESLYVVEKRNEKIIVFCQVVISILCLFTFVMLVLNYYLDYQLNLLKQTQERLVYRIEEKALQESKLSEISKKITLYKNFLQERKPLTESISAVYEKLSPNFLMGGFDLENNDFKLILTGKSPLEFTNLITAFISDKRIAEISIESAILNARDNTYTVILGGTFK